MLSVDPEFEKLIDPLTDEEFQLLKDSMLEEGEAYMPLVVWNDVIVDGHNRYRIIKEHPDISYTVYEKEFSDRHAAKAWICKNQLGRRNLTPQQKKYLIGVQYNAEKQTHGGERGAVQNKETGRFTSSVQNEHLRSEQEKTADRIARENNIAVSTVRRNEKYALGTDAAEEISPGIKHELLSGKIKATDAEVASIATAPPERRPEMVRRIVEQRDDEKPRHTIDEESMLGTLRGVSNTMIRSCNRCFDLFPTLLSEPQYKKQVIEILGEMKTYILKIEEE